MWSPLSHPVGPVGYAVAHELAAEQLTLGLDVIVECVNLIALTGMAGRKQAGAAGAAIVEVGLIGSNAVEHQHRVETRISDVEGLTKPSWPEVLGREYEPWNTGAPGLGHGRDADWQGGRANRDGDRVDQTASDRLTAGLAWVGSFSGGSPQAPSLDVSVSCIRAGPVIVRLVGRRAELHAVGPGLL